MAQGLIDLMPWNADKTLNGTNSDLTVVVTYRTPRVDQLISLWHQQVNGKGMTFKEWLENSKDPLHSIDTLHLVSEYLAQGLKVVLIDSRGCSKLQYDINNVFACAVLKVPCSTDKKLAGWGLDPALKNVRTGKGKLNITEKKLDEIEKSFKMFECQYLSLLSNENLSLLYPKYLLKNFRECPSIPSMTKEDMMKTILNITQN